MGMQTWMLVGWWPSPDMEISGSFFTPATYEQQGKPSHQLANKNSSIQYATPWRSSTSRAPHKAKATLEDGTEGIIINCGAILIGNQGGGHLFSIYVYVYS